MDIWIWIIWMKFNLSVPLDPVQLLDVNIVEFTITATGSLLEISILYDIYVEIRQNNGSHQKPIVVIMVVTNLG